MPKKTVTVENILSDMSLPGIALQRSQPQSLIGDLSIFTRLTCKDLREVMITRELLCIRRQKNDINHSANI